MTKTDLQPANALDLGFARLTPVSLEIPAELAFNDWRRIGTRLLHIADATNWAIGDWLNYGDRYRRDYDQAMALIDREFWALSNCAYVALHVPLTTPQSLLRSKDHRREALSWTHHRIVAPLPVEEQALWLDDALRQNWSKRDLEQAIAETRGKALERRPSLSVRAMDDLYDLCVRAAELKGQDPGVWAKATLERGARVELGLELAA